MNQRNEQGATNRRAEISEGTGQQAGESQPKGHVREDVAPGVGGEERRGSSLTTADLATSAREGTRQQGASASAADQGREDARTPLFASDEAQKFRSEWDRIQTAFVDDPRSSVQRADGLVAEMMQRLAQVFSAERKTLEAQWEGGGDASTEDLRVALQRYRSFFGRLLSV